MISNFERLLTNSLPFLVQFLYKRCTPYNWVANGVVFLIEMLNPKSICLVFCGILEQGNLLKRSSKLLSHRFKSNHQQKRIISMNATHRIKEQNVIELLRRFKLISVGFWHKLTLICLLIYNKITIQKRTTSLKNIHLLQPSYLKFIQEWKFSVLIFLFLYYYHV